MTTFFRSLVPSLLTGLFVACLGLAQVLPMQDPARPVIERTAGAVDGAIKKSVHDLKDPDSRIRQRAVVQLGDLGPAAKPAVGAMIIALEDQDRDIRELAALALGELGPEAKDAVPALAERLNDREESVALAAVWSLAQDRQARGAFAGRGPSGQGCGEFVRRRPEHSEKSDPTPKPQAPPFSRRSKTRTHRSVSLLPPPSAESRPRKCEPCCWRHSGTRILRLAPLSSRPWAGSVMRQRRLSPLSTPSCGQRHHDPRAGRAGPRVDRVVASR